MENKAKTNEGARGRPRSASKLPSGKCIALADRLKGQSSRPVEPRPLRIVRHTPRVFLRSPSLPRFAAPGKLGKTSTTILLHTSPLQYTVRLQLPPQPRSVVSPGFGRTGRNGTGTGLRRLTLEGATHLATTVLST